MNELCIYIKRIPTVDSTRCKVWNITIVMQIMIPTPFYYFDISHVMDFSFGVWTDFTVFDLQQQFFILHSLSHVGWLLSSWDTSEGISLHKHNMKEYFQGLVVVRTCSQRSPPPPQLTGPICLGSLSLFIWLSTAISTVVVQFIYSSHSKLILQPGQQRSRAAQSKYSISCVSPSPLYIIS